MEESAILEEASQPKTSGITWRDKVGYAFGDMGGSLFLGMVGSFLQMFYAKVLQLSQQSIGVLLLALRVWDGINDPIWGMIVDRRPAGKNGKFRPYLRAFAIPLALCGVLMFTKIPGLSETQYLIWAYITHILYEGFYTTINMPLGAMASVITDDGKERSVLSTFRTIGSGLGSMPAAVLVPMLVYTQQGDVKVLDAGKMLMTVSVFAVLCVMIQFSAFKLTTERVPPPPAEEKHNLFETIRILLRNRPYMALCFTSMLLVGVSFYTSAVYNFLYVDYFREPGLYSLLAVATYAPTALLLPFLHKWVQRFGKRNLCAFGLLISAVASTAALVLRTTDPYLFMGFCFFMGLGTTFINMQLWALIADVLDQQELLSRKREEGTCYSLFYFMRKIGQTMAGSGSAFLFSSIGYDKELPVQAPIVAGKMYTQATMVPAVAYTLMFLAMVLWYPLTPKKEEANQEALRRQRAEIELEAGVAP